MAILSSTWKKLKRKAFRAKSQASQLDTSASGNAMNRVLGPVDITFLGIGGIIGAGVFVLTGVAARQEAGCAAQLLPMHLTLHLPRHLTLLLPMHLTLHLPRHLTLLLPMHLTLPSAPDSARTHATVHSLDVASPERDTLVLHHVVTISFRCKRSITSSCRPAVVLSYLLASFAAILAAFCYIEFAVDMPVAGGAFVFINYVFGEFIGWCAPEPLDCGGW